MAGDEREPELDGGEAPEESASSKGNTSVGSKGEASATGTAATERGRRRSPYTIPGQRAVTLAFLFTLVSAATLLIAPIQVPRDVSPDDPRVDEEEIDEDDVNDDGTVTIFEEGKLVEEESAPVVAMVLVVPVAITGAALWFTKRPQRSTAWSVAMVALAGYVFFVGSYGIITLPSLIALAVGGFQSRRAENKTRMADIRAQRAARKSAGDGGDDAVIDVDSAEVTDDDDAGRR